MLPKTCTSMGSPRSNQLLHMCSPKCTNFKTLKLLVKTLENLEHLQLTRREDILSKIKTSYLLFLCWSGIHYFEENKVYVVILYFYLLFCMYVCFDGSNCHFHTIKIMVHFENVLLSQNGIIR